MKWMKTLCAMLAMLLALGGCLAWAGAEDELLSQSVDQPVEELELALGEGMMAGDDADVLATETEDAPTAEPPAEDGTGATAAPEAEDAVAPEATNTPKPTITPAPTVTPVPEPQPEWVIVQEDITLGVGDTLQLDPVVEPADAVYRKLLFSSSKKRVASVSGHGLVTARKKGEAVITVKAGNAVARVNVHVLKAPKRVTLTAERKKLSVGDTVQLFTVIPGNTMATWRYSVSPKGVAKVSYDGLLTARKPGIATVTVTTHNGVTASVELKVLPQFEITFMDIGRNDGILIQCGGEYAFIDSGMRGQGLQAAKYMKEHDVDHLRYYIGTHAHRDHVGGAPAIMAAIDTDEVIVSHSKVFQKIKVFAENSDERKAVNNVGSRVVSVGSTFKLGDAVFEVVGPVRILSCNPGDTAENANSLVVKLTYGKNSFLLTGDATGSELTEIERRNPGCMKAQVLKNPHHHGTQKYAVQVSDPEIVVFSTVSSRLPTSEYLRYIRDRGADYYITASNRDSHVTMISDGRKLKIKTAK